MRFVALLAVLASFGQSSVHAQEGAVRTHASTDFSIVLPPSFQTGGEGEVAPGRRIQVFTDVQSGRHVILTSIRGMNSVQRFFFGRGVGLRRGVPQSSFERVSVSDLPARGALVQSAASAFEYESSTGSDVGVVVRGCVGDWCYEAGASGPVTGADPSGLRYAQLLASLEARR